MFGGGRNSSSQPINVIDYVTIASAGNAVDFGNLTVSRHALASAADSTRGLFAGGAAGGDVIDYVTIATTGNATDFGDLSVSRSGLGGVGNGTNACFTGGYDNNGRSNIIDKVVVQTLGNATDHGDLTIARNVGASASGAAS